MSPLPSADVLHHQGALLQPLPHAGRKPALLTGALPGQSFSGYPLSTRGTSRPDMLRTFSLGTKGQGTGAEMWAWPKG